MQPTPKAVSLEANPAWSPREVVTNWFDVVWNQSTREGIRAFFEGEAHGLAPGRDKALDLDAYEAMWDQFHEHLTDLHIKVLDCIEEGSRAAVRFRVTGKQKKGTCSVDFEGIAFVETRAGKIVDAWNAVDFLTMSLQLCPTKSAENSLVEALRGSLFAS